MIPSDNVIDPSNSTPVSPIPLPSWRWYLIGMIPLAAYLLSVSYDVEIFFFLAVIVIVVFIITLINFELAFLFVPICLTNPYTFKETQSNLHTSELVLLVIFLVWGIRQVSGSETLSYPRKFLIPSVLIVLTAVFSLTVANYLTAGLQQIVRYIEILIVFFLVIYNHCERKQYIRRIFLFLMIGGLLASIVGLSQFVLDSELNRGATRRIFGWVGGVYGALIGSTLLFCISTLLYDRDKIYRLWALVTIPFASLALVLSQTRAWIAAFVLSALFVLLWSRRKVIGRVLLIAGLTLFTLLLVIQTNAFGLVEGDLLKSAIDNAFRFGTVPGKRSSEDLSLFLRFNTWLFSIGLFFSHPFLGIGVGGLRFVDYFPIRLGAPAEHVGYVDNQIIQFFVEVGFIGGISWIVFVYFALKEGIRTVRLANGTELHSVAIGLYGSLLIFIIGSFFWVITNSHEIFALMILDIVLLLNISKHFRNVINDSTKEHRV